MEREKTKSLAEAAEVGINCWNMLMGDCNMNVFRMLSGEEAAKVASVCSKWNNLLKNDKLWEEFYMKRWGAEVHPQRLEVEGICRPLCGARSSLSSLNPWVVLQMRKFNHINLTT